MTNKMRLSLLKYMNVIKILLPGTYVEQPVPILLHAAMLRILSTLDEARMSTDRRFAAVVGDDALLLLLSFFSL